MPPLTWSVSRDAVLHSCERRYYYQYLVNARYNSKKPLLREISLLKPLKSIPSWQGDCFHSAVGWWANEARVGRLLSLDQMLAQLRAEMKAQWQESLAVVGQNLPGTQVRCRIFEHEYGIELPGAHLEAAVIETSRWIEAFVAWAANVGLHAVIRGARNCWIEPDTFRPGAPGFKVDGQQVVVKVDLAVQSRTGMFEIWDWKTGKPREPNPRRINPAALQVNVYQLWPHLTLGVPLENIRAHLVYVAVDPVEDIVHEIDDVREYVLSIVRRSVDRVLHFSGNGDVGLEIEDFDFALSPGYCRGCNFKRICAHSLEDEDHVMSRRLAALLFPISGVETDSFAFRFLRVREAMPVDNGLPIRMQRWADRLWRVELKAPVYPAQHEGRRGFLVPADALERPGAPKGITLTDVPDREYTLGITDYIREITLEQANREEKDLICRMLERPFTDLLVKKQSQFWKAEWTLFFPLQPANARMGQDVMNAYRGFKFGVVLVGTAPYLAVDVRTRYVGRKALSDYSPEERDSILRDHLDLTFREDRRPSFLRDNGPKKIPCRYTGKTGKTVTEYEFEPGTTVASYYAGRYKLNLNPQDPVVFAKDRSTEQIAKPVPASRLFPVFTTEFEGVRACSVKP